MTLWWCALTVLCCTLNYVETSTHSPAEKYNHSFNLTKKTRSLVQDLLMEYKEHHLGNKDFEDRGRHFKGLPILSTDFYSWLQLTDWERLHSAFHDMQVYWEMLEWKRNQLEREENQKNEIHTYISVSIEDIQLDLRDLMKKVSNQMKHMNTSWSEPNSITLDLETNSKTAWESRVEGYIILRDLDLYLTKLARDFLLMASKNKHLTQH